MLLEKIGVELELNVGDYNPYFRSVQGTLFKDMHIAIDSNGNRPVMAQFQPFMKDIIVQLTDEYYSSQCEWKFFPIELSKISNLQDTMKHIVEKGGGSIVHDSMPAFVGTHIHLFFKESKKDLDSFVRGKTILSAFLMEYFYCWLKDTKLDKALKVKELERLVFNHNILQKLDYKTLNKGIRNNLNEKGFDYYYTNMPKPKYQPVHWSNPNNGKPLTLELRYIPNSFLLNSSKDIVSKFLWTVESKVNYINSLSDDDFSKEHIQNKQQCVFWHNKLLELYLQLNGSHTGHIPRYERSSMRRSGSGMPLPNFGTYFDHYRHYRSNGMNHYESHYRAIKRVQEMVFNYCDNTSFKSVEEIQKVLTLGHITDMPKRIQSYLHKIVDKIAMSFEVKALKDITVSKHVTYPDLNIKSIKIDSEGDEVQTMKKAKVSHDAIYGATVSDYIAAVADEHMNQFVRPTPSVRWSSYITPSPSQPIGMNELRTLLQYDASSQSMEPLSEVMATTDSLETPSF